MTSTLFFFHLLAFAAYAGAGFGQLRLMKRSEVVPAAVQTELEALAAAVITRVELPAIFVSIITGAILIVRSPAYLHQGWLHGKLAIVVVLAVLSHLEMFNARKIVRARAAGQDAEIAARKKRHATLGSVATVLVVVVVAMVTFVRLRGA